MAFKIYTKTGDKGSTSLIGGERVSKNHIRINAYGTVDELNSFLGMVRDQAKNEQTEEWIREIQDRLFTIGSELAQSPNKEARMKLPDLHDHDIEWLEHRIDQMNEELPPLRSFILSGGHISSSTTQVARSICRRAERNCVELHQQNEHIPELIIPYLNRLSDFLFVLARYFTHIHHGEEIPWRARLS